MLLLVFDCCFLACGFTRWFVFVLLWYACLLLFVCACCRLLVFGFVVVCVFVFCVVCV